MTRTQRLLPPTSLRPHEEIIPGHIAEVTEMIVREQEWTAPICIERRSRCIMDGHHRHVAALRLGLFRVPVIEFDYDEVTVDSWRNEPGLSPQAIIERSLTGRLLPHKTTRHHFPSIDARPVAISELLIPGVEPEV